MTNAEAQAAYDCIYGEMKTAYAKSGIPAARDWADWATKFSAVPYPSATHGGRYVQNYSNTLASKTYAKFEDIEKMPAGSLLIKDSFTVSAKGQLGVGPLFMMEKMKAGFNSATGDWRYLMILPNGKLFGSTKGHNAKAVAFCHGCHEAAEENDFVFLLPDEYRVTKN